MNLLQENLRCLLEKHPELAAKGIEHAAQGAAEIVATPSGQPTAVQGGQYIHSRYDPTREAQRLIDKELKDEAGCTIIYGFGLGYLVDAFRQRFSSLPLIVVEPNLSLFKLALGCRDLKKILSSGKIRWFLDERPEKIVMDLEALSRIQILRLRSIFRLNPDYYRKLDSLLQSFVDQKEVNVNTLNRFGKLWVRNLLQNVELFATSPGASELRGLFRGTPALVLAAGPSLDEILPHLPALRERLLIVAVDTCFGLCLDCGVEPDFLITVDPQYWNSRHLDRTQAGKTLLISESSAHPRIFRQPAAEEATIFFVSSFFPLGQMLEDIIGEKGRIGAGGSVTTSAWDFTVKLGVKSIYIAGLDLGFPGKRTHCRGAFFEERMHTVSDRITPAESMVFQYINEAAPFLAKANTEGFTLTDRRMIIYKGWFENQLKQQLSEGPVTYNLSARGVKIDGMPYRSVTQLLDLEPCRDQIDNTVEAARRRAAEHSRKSSHRSKLGGILDKLLMELEQLNSLSRQGRALCRNLAGQPQENWTEGLDALARLDHRILNSSSRQIAGFLFQPLIQKIIAGGEKSTSPDQILETSAAIYNEMEQSSRYHAEILHQTLERIKTGSPH